MELYYGIILRTYITGSYYGIIWQKILWNYITESLLEKGSRGCMGRARSPLGSRESPGHAPGTPGAPLGPLGTPLESPGDAHGIPGTPGHPHRPRKRPYLNGFTAPEALDCGIRILSFQHIAPMTALGRFAMYTLVPQFY